MRKTVKLKVLNWAGEFEEREYLLLTKQEFSIFNKRFIFSQRPLSISWKADDDYITVSTPNTVPKSCGFKAGVYAILVKDFKEILNSFPHFPNKKEAKKIRSRKR